MKPPAILTCLGILVFAVTSLLPVLFVTLAPFLANDAASLDGQSLLAVQRHGRLAVNSLSVAFGATFMALILGVPSAFLIAKTNLIARSLFGAVCVLPILIPPFMHAIVWSRLQDVIGRTTGLEVHSLWGAIWVLGLAYHPFVTLPAMSGLRACERSFEEAALLGCGKWRTAWRISLPLATPHILTGAIFVFVFSIMDFGVPDIMRVGVYPVEIFVQFSAFYNERAAAIYSLPLIGVALVLMILQRRIMGNRAYVSPGGGVPGSVSYALGWGQIPAFLFCVLIFGLSIGVPAAVLTAGAGAWSNYLRVLQSSTEQILLSFELAAASGIFTVLLAILLSYLMVRSAGWLSAALSTIVFIPFAVPSISLGIGLIEVWNRPLLEVVYGAPPIVVMGCLSRFLPFAAVIVHAGLKQIDRQLEDAASLADGSWTRMMGRVVLPLLWPSILSGFFVVFVLSLGELGTTLLVIPAGRETVPIKIYNLMHYGAESSVAGLCLIMTAAIMLCAGLLMVLLRQTGAARLRSVDARY